MLHPPAPLAVVGSSLDARVCAFRLRQAGRDVVWFDVDRPGVAADPEDAFEPTALPTPHLAPELLGLAAELRLSKTVRRQEAPAIRIAVARPGTARGSTLASAWQPPHPQGWLARRRVRRLLRWYGPWIDPRRPERGERLDDRSVADWCRLYLGAGNLARVYAPWLAAQFGLDAEETSRLFLLPLLDVGGRPRVGALLGLHALWERLGAELAQVRRTEPVRAIVAGGRELCSEAGDRIATAGTVVAMSPAETRAHAGDLLSPAERVSLDRLGSGPRLASDRRLGIEVRLPGEYVRAYPGALRALGFCTEPGDPLAAVLAPSQSSPEDPESTEVTRMLSVHPRATSALAPCSDGELYDRLTYAADRWLPGLRERAHCVRVWRSHAALPAFGVGHYRAVARLHREQAHAHGRALVLCGSYQVAPHAEGAVRAGTLAAETLLRCTTR